MPTQTEIHFLDILRGILEDKTMHPDVRMLVMGDVFEEVGWLIAAHGLRSYAYCPDSEPGNFSSIHSSELEEKYSKELRGVVGSFTTVGFHHATIPKDIVIERACMNAPEGYYKVCTRDENWWCRYLTSDCTPIAHNVPRDWGEWPFEDESACVDAWYTSDGYKLSHPGTAHPDSFAGQARPIVPEVFRFDPETVGPQKCQCLATELHHCYSRT